MGPLGILLLLCHAGYQAHPTWDYKTPLFYKTYIFQEYIGMLCVTLLFSVFQVACVTFVWRCSVIQMMVYLVFERGTFVTFYATDCIRSHFLIICQRVLAMCFMTINRNQTWLFIVCELLDRGCSYLMLPVKCVSICEYLWELYHWNSSQLGLFVVNLTHDLLSDCRQFCRCCGNKSLQLYQFVLSQVVLL